MENEEDVANFVGYLEMGERNVCYLCISGRAYHTLHIGCDAVADEISQIVRIYIGFFLS